MNNARPVNRICPFLGLSDDADTSLSFPSNWNFCHRNPPGVPVQFDRQEEFCLSGKYGECPIFLRQQTIASENPISVRHPRAKKTGSIFARNLIIVALAVSIVLVLAGQFARQNLSFSFFEKTNPIISASPRPTRTITPTPTRTTLPLPPALTGTPTLHIPFFGSVTVTRAPTKTVTPLPTLYISKHQLDTPIGTERKFIILRISGGERLEPYAEKYNTRIEAIIAINYYLYLTNPVWGDALAVIPIDFTDVSGMPVMTIYRVKEDERGENFEYLARKFKVALADFKSYNGITTPDERPLVGDLYLIPQPRRVP